jgi:hypothetical protein
MSKQRWSGLLIGLALSLLLLGACATTTAPTMEPAVVPTPTPPRMVEGQDWPFSEEGVQVTVPSQAKSVKVVKLPLASLRELPTPVSVDFEPFRPVINFEVQYEDGTKVEEFNPPIQISVRYTSDDFKNADNVGKSLKLGSWDGTTWWLYTAEKDSFQLVPDGKEPSAGGWGVVLVSKWGDPTQVWGR